MCYHTFSLMVGGVHHRVYGEVDWAEFEVDSTIVGA